MVYDTAPGDAQGGLNCPAGNPCSAGWYVVGGTSSSCPQWAGLVAIADRIAGHGLGLINPALYSLASGPNYGTYFYDVTTGNNQADPQHPGYPATTGWDPVTGLDIPNAAALVPALASHWPGTARQPSCSSDAAASWSETNSLIPIVRIAKPRGP